MLVIFLLLSYPLKSQIQFNLKNKNSIIGIPKNLNNKEFLIVTKFDCNTDTILKSEVLFENEVRINIVTNKNIYKKIQNLKIIDCIFYFNIRNKDYNIHKDSIIEIIEFIQTNDIDSLNKEYETMLGVGLGFPFGLIFTYDKNINNNRGYRLNLGLSENPSFVGDYYFRYIVNDYTEHNLSFSSGLYFSGKVDYVHGGSGKLGFLLGSSYDFKISFFIIRAGIIFAPTQVKSMLLPNISTGINIKI